MSSFDPFAALGGVDGAKVEQKWLKQRVFVGLTNQSIDGRVGGLIEPRVADGGEAMKWLMKYHSVIVPKFPGQTHFQGAE